MKLDVGCGARGEGDVNSDVLLLKQENFVLSDAHFLPFKEGVFDTIQIFETLEHLSNPSQVLFEAKRCMRKGGVLVISVPNLWNVERILRWIKNENHLFKKLKTDTEHLQGWDIYEFNNLLSHIDLKIEKAEFWDRYENMRTTLFSKIANFILPSALSKRHLKITARCRNE